MKIITEDTTIIMEEIITEAIAMEVITALTIIITVNIVIIGDRTIGRIIITVNIAIMDLPGICQTGAKNTMTKETSRDSDVNTTDATITASITSSRLTTDTTTTTIMDYHLTTNIIQVLKTVTMALLTTDTIQMTATTVLLLPLPNVVSPNSCLVSTHWHLCSRQSVVAKRTLL